MRAFLKFVRKTITLLSTLLHNTPSPPPDSMDSTNYSLTLDSINPKGWTVWLRRHFWPFPMENPRRVALVTAPFLAFLVMIGILTGLHYCGLSSFHSSPVASHNIIISYNSTLSAGHRKLFGRATATTEAAGVVPDRVLDHKCSKADIVINQRPTAPLLSGVPTYTVEIVNVCVTGCDIAGIHLRCGWFNSTRLINPRIFERLRYDDCLVNNGKSLANGRTLAFQYANTVRYRLSVSSVIC